MTTILHYMHYYLLPLFVHCVSKKRTPETFYYNFAKIALIEIKIRTHNLHMM